MKQDSTTKLSPFEFKDELIKLARQAPDHAMLNAGRGNPNFLATLPRHAYLRLGEFALQESERAYSYLDALFGGMPDKTGIVGRFDHFVVNRSEDKGIAFLSASLAFIEDHMGIDKADCLLEMVTAFLGCTYPYPPRMLPIFERVVQRYLQHELFTGLPTESDFDLYATEGGTAAMTYIFQSLQLNGLLSKGDRIAMITPIFSPYLEIPVLPEYALSVEYIHAIEENGWQVPKAELDKLANPEIKLLCLVNPSNPPSVKMDTDSLAHLAAIVREKNPNLMIVTDDVYATFSNQFESLFARCPYNTLCVYSFSKYFGATGWRIGTIGLHKDNVFDELVRQQPAERQSELDTRYGLITKTPRSLPFIDRLVADSRSVALNHTAGISLPQQLQMTLFALSNLLDARRIYQQDAKQLIQRRYNILLQSISSRLPEFNGENLVGYYTLLDLEQLADILFDDEKFVKWVPENYSCNDLLRRLASEAGVVLLPGDGFATDQPCARVSLANLREYDYRMIGIAVRKILNELHQQYHSAVI